MFDLNYGIYVPCSNILSVEFIGLISKLTLLWNMMFMRATVQLTHQWRIDFMKRFIAD